MTSPDAKGEIPRVAHGAPWRVMTMEEYRAFFVKDRHTVQFDYDNAGNVAVWLHGNNEKMTEAELLCGLQDAGLIPTEPAPFLAIARELDRLSLVIESAVRYADIRNRPLVVALLDKNKAELAKAAPPLRAGAR